MPNVNAEFHGVACADPREIVRELKLQRTKMDSLEVRVRSFRLSRRRATLGFVIVVSSTHAKIVTLMFALATLYGSVCSASCVAGVCPNFEHYSESHDCHQPGQHHSHGQDDHGQHGPDCRIKASLLFTRQYYLRYRICSRQRKIFARNFIEDYRVFPQTLCSSEPLFFASRPTKAACSPRCTLRPGSIVRTGRLLR